MAYKNKEDKKKYQREWHIKNRDKVRENRREKRLEMSKWLREYRKSFTCSRCKEGDYRCIDFHHVKGIKFDSVSNMIRRGSSKSTILKEIEKCIPLCSNCHRKETFKNTVR